MTAAVLHLHRVTDDNAPAGSLPRGMVRAALAGLRSPPTLLHRQIAERIRDDAVTDDDAEVIAAYNGQDAALLCLGGPVGRLWAQERLAAQAQVDGVVKLFGARDAYAEGTRWWVARERALRVPAELRLARVMAGLYRRWVGRIVEAIAEVMTARHVPVAQVRDLTAAELAALFDGAAALVELKAEMGPQLLRVIELAFAATAKDMAMSGSLAWSPTYLPPAGAIGTKIVAVPETVRAAVEAAVNRGLAEGLSVGELQASVKRLPEMSTARALTVARTESARVVTEGSNAAMQAAQAAGARVTRRWVSARDAATRPSHRALEGKEVAVGQAWTFPDGTATQGPGLSGVAGEDINCRCAVRPVIKKEPTP